MEAVVTIVSGLPRSGTSLMIQMLARGGMPVLSDGLRPADEDNPRGYFELEAVKHTVRDRSWLREAPGKAVKVIHLLLMDLPAEYMYRVLFMRRPLDEVLRSQQAMLARSHRQGASISGERLMATFAQQVARVRTWLDAQPNFQVLDVEYHACVREPLATAAAVNAFLGGTVDDRAMAGAVVPSLHRQR